MLKKSLNIGTNGACYRNMGTIVTFRDPLRTPHEIQARLRVLVDGRTGAADPAPHRWPSHSRPPFPPRPNYAILSSLLAALVFAASDVARAATIRAASPSFLDVSTAVASAEDGDTVVIPPGTASWTTGLGITKSITLIGATTTDPVAKTANDQTIILDDITKDWVGAISLNPSAGKTVRVSGITFKPGTRTTTWNGGVVVITGVQGAGASVRLDHCHFFGMHRNRCIYVGGAVYGVIDHNLFSYSPSSPFTGSILVRMANWNGDTNGTGDKSFADYPWFGTEKFIFIEDNCFDNTSGIPLMGVIDGDFGNRMVIRYNHGYDWQVQTHGTENRHRGTRAAEIYNNAFHFTTSTPLGGLRTGSFLYHDNTFDGTEGSGPTFSYLRAVFRFLGVNGFYGASGDSPWDVNADSDGVTPVTYGQPGHSFVGTRTCASGSNTTTIVDSDSPGWTPNQWAKYTVKRVSDGGISMIISNTPNTLTVTFQSGGYGSSPTWTAGDEYQIRKVLIALDQPGRGKGDLIIGGYDNPPPTRKSVTGTEVWPNQALEPCYSWNNIYSPGSVAKGFIVRNPSWLAEGVDYYNDSSSAAAIAKYVAALNGVDYTGPYTYPHPLVTGLRTAPQNLRVLGQ